jgi:hypothetical protein
MVCIWYNVFAISRTLEKDYDCIVKFENFDVNINNYKVNEEKENEKMEEKNKSFDDISENILSEKLKKLSVTLHSPLNPSMSGVIFSENDVVLQSSFYNSNLSPLTFIFYISSPSFSPFLISSVSLYVIHIISTAYYPCYPRRVLDLKVIIFCIYINYVIINVRCVGCCLY